RLCEEIGEQFVVMIGNRVMRNGRCQKIARYHLRALVNKLIKRVLAVGTGFTPDDRAGLVQYGIPVPVDRLPVAFHIPLLEIGSETVQVLVVREDRLGTGAEEIVVPHAE